jgi:ABC-type thiamin/hydroxymethylpyrimidine transport system permease subunit
MNRTTIFSGAIIVTLLALVLAVYYAIPGVYHVLVSGSHPPLSPQPAHVVLFGVIAFLGVLMALVNRPRPTRR